MPLQTLPDLPSADKRQRPAAIIRAAKAMRPTNTPQVIPTGTLVGKAPLEVQNVKRKIHCMISLTVGAPSKCGLEPVLYAPNLFSTVAQISTFNPTNCPIFDFNASNDSRFTE